MHAKLSIDAGIEAMGAAALRSEEKPECSSHLWGVSCGHTSCPLHGPWEKKWAGRGWSAERAADFDRMVLGVSETQESQ